ncbi:lysylphosphatidylglycerol synthase transmembrane domain-containing protein [Myceligenerans pegani]|uniref:Flippase-like domain-containing protein n=1 Tax=Myceligenerans pegani TaxID=2776917 RepID=A0ABR9N2V6_9MICO|nr:lysylphosphatidylglycerol synthase transmembrane domain-containing protein [Myceligenerans sp. TRM 65318]MBE1877978.1 flippase-like domain-containing protein [Myceligenerans sp. TRM 65318]MBE3020249.1 flippase-like domain-containing protein [Myceligenerans sp. TRM 65318]
MSHATERADPVSVVRVVDTPEVRVRHPRDLLGLVVSALGVVLVLVMSVAAHGTTEGVTEDVRNFNDLVADILFIPVVVLQGVVAILGPVAVLAELGLRRLGRQVVESIVAGISGLVIGILFGLAVRYLGSDDLVRGMSVWVLGEGYQLIIPTYAVALTALLTVAGPATRRRTVRWSWNLLFAALLIVLITGQVSLPGVLVALLLGRTVGQAVQYVSGVRSERAYGPDLVTAVRRAGFRPQALVRVRALSDDAERRSDDARQPEGTRESEDDGGPLTTESVMEVDGTGGATTRVPVSVLSAPRGDDVRSARPEPPSDPATLALARTRDTRVYALFTDDGVRRDVVVLDGDRQVVGTVTRLWRALRLRGIEGRAAISLKAVAERHALLSYAAMAAGVRTPRLHGIGEAGDSVALVLEHPQGATPLAEVPVDDVDAEVLAEAWDQLGRAHGAGLTHRALAPDVLLVHRDDDGHPHVWLTGWEQGDIASSPLSRRLDLVQMLALLSVKVGARRAVASAVRALPDEDIAAIGPLIQSIALPRPTREALRAQKGLIGELRDAIVEHLPEADIQPQRITRFGARTVVMLTLTIVAVAVVVGTISFEQIADAVRGANPWWVAVAYAFGLITWFGAALTLVAFSPTRVSLFRATLTQAAGSFVALAAPAGIGPAALNLRLLTQRAVPMSMAVATVALVQVSQFVVTVLLLIVMSVFTGEGVLVELPSASVLIALGAVAAAVVAVLLVPRVRRWALEFVRPRIRQVWPRLASMLSHPGRLAVGVAGNLVMTLGYALTFDACLRALGESLPLVDVALVYLVGNALGALLPTPGGLGGVEGAMTAGLAAAGLSPALAVSGALLYRVVTYWGRIPLGWVAMRYLERKGDL